MDLNIYYKNQMLEQQINELIHNHHIDLVYADFDIFYKKFDSPESAYWYSVCLPEFNPSYLYQNIPGLFCVWRKSLHETVGYLDESFQYLFFWEFWNRCATYNITFKKINGIAGSFFFDYHRPQKKFLNRNELEQEYNEDSTIRTTYQHLWNLKYTVAEKPFVIITASYNNRLWYKRNLDSILFQNYYNYRIIYINDASTDQTGKLVEEYIKKCHKEEKITIINNQERTGALSNIYNTIHSCDKDAIIVLVDGDDWLAHNNVLNHLNALYQDTAIWMTYGQFQWFPEAVPGFAKQLPPEIIQQNTIRSSDWSATHLRTFYAWLFQKIKKEDLLYEDLFYPMAWDLAIMLPMLEMAKNHSLYSNEIFYIYNIATTLNDYRIDPLLQSKLDSEIRNKKKYLPL